MLGQRQRGFGQRRQRGQVAAPTLSRTAVSQLPPGNCHSVLVTKAAVGVPWVFSATKVRPCCITVSVYFIAPTMLSQAITRSAFAVSTFVV